MPVLDNNSLRIINTTYQKFFRGVEEAVFRRRVLWAKLKAAARIKMKSSGTFLDWKARYNRAPLQGILGGSTLTFQPREQYRTLQVPWGGVAATDSIYEIEMLQNSGNEAIVKLWDGISRKLEADLQDGFAEVPYLDGGLSTNTTRMHGIETFLGNNSVSTKMPIGINDDTYAGMATDLATEGGSWSTTGTNDTYTDWPRGKGDYSYDWFTPLIVNYTSTITTSAAAGNVGWSPPTKTWASTCLEAMSFLILGLQKNDGASGAKTDFIIMDQGMMSDLRAKLRVTENLQRMVNQGPGSLYSLGFTDTINFDGVDCIWEYGVPVGVGYAWATGLTEFHSLKESLFNPEGPFYREDDCSYRSACKVYGQFKFGNENGGVRNFGCLKGLG